LLVGKAQKMRILWVKAGKLLPVNRGVNIRSYNILRCLANDHEVTLLSYYAGRRDLAYESEIGHHLPGALVVYTSGMDTSLFGRGIDYLLRLPSGLPYSVAKFTAPEIQHTLRASIQSRRFDIAVCDFLTPSSNFPQALATPTVLFQHNVESELWRRQAERQSNWVKKLVFSVEARRLFRYEQMAVKKFHHIIAVSEHDRDEMTKMAGPLPITVIPTGVDFERYRAARRSSPTEPTVVFTGDMSYEPNVDGVAYLCREIWPRVRMELGGARLRLVGRNPHRRVRAFASDSVEVTGTVPSVVEYLQQAAVVVVPLRVGAGTRLKIYEAMAMGKAVVSTTIGAEGLDVHHGRDIVLADDPLSFANAIVTLLRDQEVRKRYEAAAAELASRYDWSRVSEEFAAILERIRGVSPLSLARPVAAVVP
jgi:glycosyltransferase involved in cell wall biosynthesis